MYAKLTVAGRLGRDAELRSVGNGQVIRFSIPHSTRTSTGEERTLWIECSYWRNAGESTEVLRFLKKGAVVLVEGAPSVRLYTRQDNTPGVTFECRVTTLRVLVYSSEGGVSAETEKSPSSGEAESGEPDEEPYPPTLSDVGDLPF
jgi:single-strand DNA-binding protein